MITTMENFIINEKQKNKKFNLYFDTEFTGLHKNTTLISIGIISDNNKTFYAELTDYDKSQVDDWIKTNVISNLLFEDEKKNIVISDDEKKYQIKGDSKFLKTHLTEWLSKFSEVEIWSDCLSYDWVLFCDIFGTVFDIPKNVYYIPFDISTLFKLKRIDPDISREEFTGTNDNKNKHNALFDAKVIKKCYEKLVK